jgi:hypothetical protein
MTEAEKERLTMLAEEAAEIIQMVTKILRHGYDSYHPNDPLRTTNNILLQEEITDMLSIIYAMNEVDDMDVDLYDDYLHEERWSKKLKWTHHQKDDFNG